MKSKRAKEYIKTIKLNKANVDYCLEHGRVNGFLLIDIENAVELAEQDAEEEIEMLTARAVEAHRDCCMFRTRKEPLEPDDPFLCEANYHMQGELCDQDCGYMQIFIRKLNER
jgi:hypothetical protein